VGKWRYSSTILNLGTRRRSVVSFTPWPIYRMYPLYRSLGGPQSRSRYCGEEKNLLPLPGIEHRLLGRRTRSPSRYRLSYPDSHGIAQRYIPEDRTVQSVRVFKLSTETLSRIVNKGRTGILIDRKPNHLCRVLT
jgi:hypothetical protein